MEKISNGDLKSHSYVIARYEGLSRARHDEPISCYIMKSIHVNWDCFAPSCISALPRAMTLILLRCPLVILCSLFTTALTAQSSIDLFTLSGMYGFPSAYQEPLNGKATETNLLVNLKLPMKIHQKTLWYNDFTYSGFNVTTDLPSEPSDYLTSMRLHGFILQTGIVQKLDDRNGFQLLFVPRYMSDFNGSDPKSWQFGGIALYEHRSHERLLMRFGALYNQELFGPLVVPLVYLDWQMNDKWSMVGLIPINLKINYKVADRLTVGFSHFGFITTYCLGQEEFKGDYIERNSIDETLFARWNTSGNFFIEVRVGYSLSRVYEQYDESEKMDFRLSIVRFGDDRTPRNVNFDNGLIGLVRLVYSLPIK